MTINMALQQRHNLSAMKSDTVIPLKVHREYIKYHDKVDTGCLDASALVEESKRLFAGSASLAEKKHILFSLAHVGTLETINILQRYLEKPDRELVAWATLCFNECRMQIKSEELGEDGDLILTGTGGEGNCLRYYMVVSAEGNKPFSEGQKQKVKAGFETVGNLLGSKVESIEFGQSHTLISALIPFDVAPAEFIEKGIHACNKGGSFLRFHYYVTNIRRPSGRHITEYLKGVV